MKIHSVGTEMLHADRRTHTMKLTVAFRRFVNAPIKLGITRNATVFNTDLNTQNYLSLFFREFHRYFHFFPATDVALVVT